MPTLVVHHLERSRSHRILWLLEELEVPYELREYRRDPTTMRAPASLRAVHPLGKSPVVSIDGKTYAESGAIIEELLDAVGGAKAEALRPSSPEARAHFRFFMHYAEGSLMSPLLVHLITSQLRGDKIPLLIRPIARGIAKKIHANFTKPELMNHARFLEGVLAERPFLTGDSLSAADIQMSYPLEAMVSRGALSAEHPHALRFLEKLRARPAYQKAVERGGPVMLGA